MSEENTVKSLVRALQVLECFSASAPELGVTEIANKLGMRKSTIFNILSTYQSTGYLVKLSSNKYRLSNKVLYLGYVVSSSMNLQQHFMPHLKEIANETGEVCYLGLLDAHEVLYLEAVYPTSQVQTRIILGERAPLYCTGLGKAMLAHLPEAEISDVLSQPMHSFTKCTLTDAEVLQAELAEVRSNGFAVDNMEHEFGIRCVAVPFFGANGSVLGAVSISGPSLRFDPKTILRNAGIIEQHIQSLQYCF